MTNPTDNPAAVEPQGLRCSCGHPEHACTTCGQPMLAPDHHPDLVAMEAGASEVTR